MPGFPQLNRTELTAAAYSKLAHRLETFRGEVYPLHIGDTWMEPAVGCRMQDLKVEDHPGLHRYSPPQGMSELLDALAERLEQRTNVATSRENILVTAGATGALGAVLGAMIEPGDEVLILAPFWPLITGIVSSFHGVPVAVPFLGPVGDADDAIASVSQALTSRSVALYLSTPNNPTGKVIPRPWLEALVAWARDKGLWILADEVYEDYQYEGQHTPCRPLAPERTLAVHSFSKAYGMAGNRCGYVAGPQELIKQFCKVSTHTFYSTPTAAQIAALRVLGTSGDAWIEGARLAYQRSGERTAERLGVDPPQGSTFLFLDLAEHLDQRGLSGFLEDCADRGLLVAPGPSFGPYPTHIRLCFTCAPPDVIDRGVEILATLLGR